MENLKTILDFPELTPKDPQAVLGCVKTPSDNSGLPNDDLGWFQDTQRNLQAFLS